MRQFLVDTNVLIDVIGADEEFGERSRSALELCAEEGVLVINPVVLAEVSAVMSSLEELDQLLPMNLIRRDPLPWEAAFLAGQALARYKRRSGTKERGLADFLIGAHAAVEGFVLITRDAGYTSYFDLQLLDPVEA